MRAFSGSQTVIQATWLFHRRIKAGPQPSPPGPICLCARCSSEAFVVLCMFSCFLKFEVKSSQVIGCERAKETKSVKHESLPRRNMFKFR